MFSLFSSFFENMPEKIINWTELDLNGQSDLRHLKSYQNRKKKEYSVSWRSGKYLLLPHPYTFCLSSQQTLSPCGHNFVEFRFHFINQPTFWTKKILFHKIYFLLIFYINRHSTDGISLRVFGYILVVVMTTILSKHTHTLTALAPRVAFIYSFVFQDLLVQDLPDNARF